VSKVCYRGGVLLAFVAPLATFGKCKENRPILTPLDRPLQNLNKTKWVNLVKLPRCGPIVEPGASNMARIGGDAFIESVNFDMLGISAWQLG
jgi:hypothetical protein